MRIRFGLPLLAILCLVPVASLVVHADAANSDEAIVKVDAVKQAFDNSMLSDTDLSTDDASAVNLDDGASDLHRRWGGRGWGRGWGRGYGWGGYWGGYWGGFSPWYYNYYYPWFNYYY